LKQSAGILLYKKEGNDILVFLVHPGGPFWKNKDLGVWSIPKGEFTNEEQPLNAAIREFEEEIGIQVSGDFIPLHPVKLKSGKTVHAWALEKDIAIDAIQSNTFEITWPPRSGKFITIPEIDQAAWFPAIEAMEKINAAQADFITQLMAIIEKGR
jgi:predicted NUDIX family NTP pyrophosphohydrolase